MKEKSMNFEAILTSTLHMLRMTWKVDLCIFLQMDDHGKLTVRSSDGLSTAKPESFTLDPRVGAVGECCGKNAVVEVQSAAEIGEMLASIHRTAKANEKYVLAPVSGETRVIGMLILGPFPKDSDIHTREAELRSAGALCAVLSAHWRLYEWMDSIVPQLNHSLRTPLTAVQGSIGMVLGGVFGQVGNDVKEMLEMAQKGCERTVRAIEVYISTQNPPKT